MCRLFLVFLLSCSLLAANSNLLTFNQQSVEVLKGHIVSVQKYTLVNKPVPYIQFLLSSNGMEYTVEVGPVWYVASQGLILVPKEEVEVKGSVISVDGHKVILASQLRQEGGELKLRREDGTPLWGSDS
jgi:hypothetical protein